MKINFNKELLLKHRFWIMLGAAVLLGTTTLVLVGTVVRAAIDQNRLTLDKAADKGKAESGKEAKTLKMIGEVNTEEEKLSGTRGGIHKEGYLAQKSIYAFPAELESKFEFTHVPEARNSPEKGLFAEMIRINKEKDAVADNDLGNNIVHGVITETEPTFIRVRDNSKSKKVWKFYDSPLLAPDKNKIFHVGQIAKPLSAFRKLEVGQSVSVFFQKGKFFGDALTSSERLEFREVYKNQIYPILALVDPIDENGKGRVRLGSWDYVPNTEPPASAGFFDMPRNKKGAEDDNPWPVLASDDFSEDFWIFEENLWIYKEIFTLIKDANDAVAKFEVKRDEGKNPAAYVCTNPYWEVKLVISGEDTIEATFKNVLSRGQKLDFELKLIVADAVEPVMVKSPKTPPVFNPRGFSETDGTATEGKDVQTVTLKVVAGDGKSSVDLRQAEIQQVWQELNWETAAVRRIDGIYVSAINPSGISESHRSFPKALKAYVPPGAGGTGGDAKGPAAASDAKAAPAPAGKGPGANPAPAGKEKDKGAGKDGGKKSIYGSEETTTKLGQTRERYIEATNQLRRLPVAVCLTVEQSQVDRVQTAFINSKLRFLPEQVPLTHSAGSLNPAAAKREGGTPRDAPRDRPNPGGSKKGKDPGKDFNPGKAFNPGKEVRPNQPNANAGGGGSAGDELETNVEIVIYGVITIYERFPYRAVRPNWN